MDPLSISASVAGLTASCLQTAKALRDLKDKFDNANLTISAICTETTLISASMSHIQSCILKDPDAVSDKLQSHPSLESTLDQALTGCYVVFDILESEILRLTESEVLQNSVDLKFTAKLRYVWSESTMKELLGQMRGLQTALGFIMQLLGVGTITELKKLMDQNTAILNEVAQHTSRISASANKYSRAPRSIYDMSFKTLSISEDETSLYSSRLFTFDDEVVNSTAYRQVLAKAYAREKSTSPGKSNDAADVQREEVVFQDTNIHDTSEESTLNSGESEATRATAHTTASIGPLLITSDPVKKFLGDDLRNTPEWQNYWSLGPELDSVPRKEIQRQDLIHEIITTERRFLQQVQVVQYLYYYRLALEPSKIVTSGSNQEFAEKTFSFHEQFYHLHKTFLYDPLVKRQEIEGPWITNISDIFQKWLSEAAPLYLKYFGLCPHLSYVIEDEASKSVKFQSFLNQVQQHRLCDRLSWISFIKAPPTRLQRYGLYFETSLRYSNPTDERHGYQAMKKVNMEIRDLALKCDTEFSRSNKEVDMKRLRAQIKPTLSEGTVASDANILFDEDLAYQKRGFGRATQLRVVVLGSAVCSMVLVLSKTSKLAKINDDTISYELVIQVSWGYE
ncbi:unnamed protein product [Penicillium pancosmium]